MGWEDAPIVQAAPKSAPWESAPVLFRNSASQPRAASGISDAIQAGYQGSATGLAIRGKLPDVVLDPSNSAWYERLAAGLTQIGAEFPAMVVGGVIGGGAGGAAGTAVPVIGNAMGAAIGAGAGAFAVPAAIRESYIQAYQKGEITDSADFLNRASVVLQKTGKEAVIGGLTGGAGRAATVAAEAAGLGAVATTTANITAQAGTLTVAPALMEGRLPEPRDFIDAAVLLVGLKGAGVASSKLMDIYAKTGKTPSEVMADAKRDPTILEDLGGKPQFQPPVFDYQNADGTFVVKTRGQGEIGGTETAQRVQVTTANVVEQGKGYVVEGYASLAKYALDRGKVLESDSSVSESAVRVYEGLARRGFTVERNPDAQLAERGTSRQWETPDKSPVFRVTAAPEPVAEIPRAYQDLARQENARNAVPEPSAEAAKFLEKPFADIPQLPGEPVLKTHVNYNYINAAEDARGALARMSELYEAQIKQATRGEVPWEQTYAEARDLYRKTTGEEPPVVPLTNADYAKLSADLYARKELLTSGAEQLMAQRNAYAEARKRGEATDQMKLDLLAQIDRVAQAQAAVRGSQAEVGRALNILKSTNRDKAYYDELNTLLNGKFGVQGDMGFGKNFDTMIDMMGALGSPKEALTFAGRASKATTWQKIVEAWKAGLVSGPITQTANVLGNTTFLATRPLVDAVAVTMNAVRSTPERMSAVEPLARVIGNIHGTIDGAKAAWAVLKTGEAMGGKAEARQKAIEGTLGEVVRSPFRLLGSADAFFRILNERGEAFSLASREAAKEGYNPATREFRERVAELASNPPERMAEAISDAGMRFTFNMPLGEKGRAIQNTITKLHLEWAVPFVQTPANVFKEMARLSPAAPIVKEWRDAMKKGGPEADKAMAEVVLGTAIGTTVFAFAVSGYVSGQGDPDPKKRATQMASGWQPYSIKIGDTWYSYQRLQPVGTLFGMAADVATVWDNMTPEESDKIPKILSTAFANAVTNQTFLQGITNIINAMSDPQRFGPKFVQNMAASTVPAVVGQTAQMMDPYQREVYSVLDAVKARLPGVREDLMPKRDPYGEPIVAKERLGEISPVTVSSMSNDKVRLEAARLGVGVAKSPENIELPAGKDPKLGRVELTPEQRDIFADKAGKMAYQILTQLVNAPGWDTMPDLVQRNAMQKVFEDARKIGRAAAVPPEQIQREAERISRELQLRLQAKPLSP